MTNQGISVRPGTKILIVDDNPTNRMVLSKTLQFLGVEFDSASNGREAVDLVSQGGYALVLMDMQMPVLDGVGATREIRQLPDEAVSKVPIIALTAHAMAEHEAQCREAGMDDFASKPLNLEALKGILTRYVGA